MEKEIESKKEVVPIKSEKEVVPIKSEKEVVPIESKKDVVPIESEKEPPKRDTMAIHPDIERLQISGTDTDIKKKLKNGIYGLTEPQVESILLSDAKRQNLKNMIINSMQVIKINNAEVDELIKYYENAGGLPKTMVRINNSLVFNSDEKLQLATLYNSGKSLNVLLSKAKKMLLKKISKEPSPIDPSREKAEVQPDEENIWRNRR